MLLPYPLSSFFQSPRKEGRGVWGKSLGVLKYMRILVLFVSQHIYSLVAETMILKRKAC